MTYQSLYRKYRSQNFSELVGQSHVALTLNQAVKRNQIAHAYLFSGPRGTGKTSSARILAKMLNCEATRNQAACEDNGCVCHKITASQSMDVIEIDAASHTGVDHMRALNDQVQLVPVESDYKIIIIDEAHMLSTGAFNALLKTLEEPPQNVIFVLATTEFHKIPVTIRSRCQHFQFKFLAQKEIVAHLNHIASEEKLPLDEEAAHYIARYSRGCMRDALSLLDQASVARVDRISVALLCEISGSVDIAEVLALVASFFEKDAEPLMKRLMAFDQQGVNVFQLCQDLVDLLQDMMNHKCQASDEVADQEWLALAERLSWSQLLCLFDAVSSIVIDLKWHPFPLTLLQLTLLKSMPSNYISSREPVAIDSQLLSPKQDVAMPELPRQEKATLKPENITAKPTNIGVKPTNIPEKPSNSPKPTAATQPSNAIQSELSSPNASQDFTVNIKDPESIAQHWQRFLEHLQNNHKGLFALLRSSRFVGFEQNTWLIELSDSYQFFLEKLKESKTLDMLKSQASSIGFEWPQLTFKLANELQANQGDAESSQAEAEDPMQTVVSEAVPAPAREGLSLNEIIKLFEGTLISG